MNKEKIIVVPPKVLSTSDKNKLVKNGYIVIETEKPDEVKFLTPQVNGITTNDVLDAAIESMANDTFDYAAKRFLKIWNEKIKSKPKKVE